MSIVEGITCEKYNKRMHGKVGNINRDNKVVYRDLWVSEIFEDKNISLNQKLVNWLCVYVFGRRT